MNVKIEYPNNERLFPQFKKRFWLLNKKILRSYVTIMLLTAMVCALQTASDSSWYLIACFGFISLYCFVRIAYILILYARLSKVSKTFSERMDFPVTILFDDQGIRKTSKEYDLFNKWSWHASFFEGKDFLAICEQSGFSTATIVFRKDLSVDDYNELAFFVSNNLKQRLKP